jgi:clathrin heavy chain
MQAKYLVEKKDEALWAKVLNPENDHRKHLIDSVVSTALPESKDDNEVSETVKAFMAAELPHELIDLLERIVLHNNLFANNENLQNLMILTAVKTKQEKVMDYINRLENYNGNQLAAVCKEYNLFEQALVIYKKFEENVLAIQVMLNNLNE